MGNRIVENMVNRKMPATIKNLKRKPGKHSYTKKDMNETQKVGIRSFQDTRIMSSSSDIENQNPSCEMEQLSLQSKHSRRSEDPAKSIKQMISKSVKELIDECRANREAIDSSDVSNPTLSEPFQRQEDADSSHTERKQRGRSAKNPVVGEKVVFFSLPDDFDAEHIKDLDKVKERLGEWMIQRRQRDSKLTDTYYRHLGSSVTFRSVKEVTDFIFSGSVPKVNIKRKEAKSVISGPSFKKVKNNKTKLGAIPEEVAAENIRDSISNAKDVEGTTLHENCGQESETPEEATENVGNAKLDGADEVDDFKDDIYDQLQDLTMDWKSNNGISDAYFDEYGMLNYIPMEVQILSIEANNDGESQNMKEHSKEEVDTTLQGRCGQEFETHDEATKRVEEDDFGDNIYDQLEDLNMGRKSNYGMSNAYFDEYNMSVNVSNLL